MRESFDTGSQRGEEFSLDDRYTVTNGGIWLSGIQAIARLALDQSRIDHRSGIKSAGYISGYRGSPLGGLDRELARIAVLYKDRHIEFQPGINEDLAATAVWGTQQVNLFPRARYQGVYGLWYGKAPGLDRSSDAVRHANMAGTSPYGGVLAIVGDDPRCKSSTLPSNSFGSLSELGLPTLDPADVSDVLEFGLYGWALSRFSGLWTGMIAQTAVMDSTATFNVDLDRFEWHIPIMDVDPHIRLNDSPHAQEARFSEKIALANSFILENPIDKTYGCETDPELVVVSSGVGFNNTQEALALLGFDNQGLVRARIRLVKLGLVWPMADTRLQWLLGGAKKVIVVENKRPFIEDQIRASVCGGGEFRIFGKHTPNGETLFSNIGELSVGDIVSGLNRVLNSIGFESTSSAYLERMRTFAPSTLSENESTNIGRLPLFCPGCPHAVSTKIPDGSRAMAGIGCHYMVQWMDRNTHTFTHMGGEGANWIGQQPFTDESHVFVNLGDGTYFHSGLLAIRAAIAAGVNVTYKLLFNDAVAMTGGQPVEGNLTVPDIVNQVRAEGAAAVQVVAEDTSKYVNVDFEVSPRIKLDKVQRELREVEGCTVLIYDQVCTNELRRKRKRGLAPTSQKHIFINQDVCEGCGDCSVKSGCSAIEPLDTEFGVKRKIDLTRCNQDLSCLDGYCPALVEVHGDIRKPDREKPVWVALPDVDVPLSANLLIAGVGGTGVVTASQILAVAAHLEGKNVSTLDMTGLAQKGGAVISHVRIHPNEVHRTGIPEKQADVLIAADVVTAATQNTRDFTAPDRTVGVINSDVQPTAEFVLNFRGAKSADPLLSMLRKSLKTSETIDADERSLKLTGSSMGANIFLIGFAWQKGLIPLSAQSIEHAIRLNKAGSQDNMTVFRAGRQAFLGMSKLHQFARPASTNPFDGKPMSEFLSDRLDFLEQYGEPERARELLHYHEILLEAENRVNPESDRLTRIATSNHFRFLSPKDEYEVARLLTSDRFSQTLNSVFERGYSVKHAFAPTWLPLKDKGKKIKLGSWVRPLLAALRSLKWLRGSAIDPFKWSSERKLERELIDRYRTDFMRIAEQLNASNFAIALKIHELYAGVCGYGHVREGKWETARPQIDELLNTHFSLQEQKQAA